MKQTTPKAIAEHRSRGVRVVMLTGDNRTTAQAVARKLGIDEVQAEVVRARQLSRAVMRNIRQNLFLAFVYNAVGVPLAAGVLYPFLGLLLSPMVAAAAMSLSSVSVVGNALRLRGATI